MRCGGRLRDYFFNGGVNQLQFTHSNTCKPPPRVRLRACVAPVTLPPLRYPVACDSRRVGGRGAAMVWTRGAEGRNGDLTCVRVGGLKERMYSITIPHLQGEHTPTKKPHRCGWGLLSFTWLGAVGGQQL